MLSVSPNSFVRSSLEEMLDSLRRRDENEKPKDLPPALPARPKPNSRARLPSAKRQLPKSSESQESEPHESSSNSSMKNEDLEGSRKNFCGMKRMKEMDGGESPYVLAPADELEHEPRMDNGSAELMNLPHASSHWSSVAEGDGSFDYSMKKKLRVWCRLRNGLWESGQIQSNFGEKATVLLSDASVNIVSVGELLPANPDILEGVDDLIQLSYLNEPSVLHNLHYRYCQGMTYSKAGPVLVSINPFKDVQSYGNDIPAYRRKRLNRPHVYAVADTAYNQMMSDETNQSIVISGKSGSGKTEIARLAVCYLAELGRGSGGIESEILHASCILEAFGNAKSSMNDNSSRFGMLTEIHFTDAGKICSAKLQTFHLEKSRVVQLAQGERSFHIFYQLCAGVSDDLRDRLRLKRASDYKYLNESDCLKIQDVDDAQKLQNLLGALNNVGICKEDQEHSFEMIAAVLWLGNITFLAVDGENYVEVIADEAVTNCARLIGCSTPDLILSLSTRGIQAGKDTVSKRLTLQQARDTRDALAKFIYSSLFDWLVGGINASIAGGYQCSRRSISILDIRGFESLKKNGFEQLFINYANERIQQHFNRHIFKLVQEEFEVNGIDWTKIDFEDNQGCLDLFEKKPTGLLFLLDEVSGLTKATDLTFVSKLKKQFDSCNCFKGERDGTFIIKHYAGEVCYGANGFLQKNRDLVQYDIIQLLLSSTSRLPRLFASSMITDSERTESLSIQSGMSTSQMSSVASKFKAHLFKLTQQLESTTPHFIHCIKPNGRQLPGVFEKDLVLEQLRCCGIVEAVRISRSGYPTRMSHQKFARRYGLLLPENNACCDPLSTSISILQKFNILPGMYQVGYTKLFFRTGQLSSLENVRKQILRGTLDVQRCFRGYRSRQYLHELKGGIIILQSYIRGEIARKQYGLYILQKLDVVKKMNQQLMAVVQIQSAIRGWLVRRNFIHLPRSKQARRRISEVKDLSSNASPSIVELRKQVLVMTETLGQKEKENEVLKEQLQQFEVRWFEYENKMKSMEEMWQNQMTSLQMNLASTKKSVVLDKGAGLPRRFEGSQPLHCRESEELPMETQIPGSTTAIKLMSNGVEGGTGRGSNGGTNAVTPLVKEFELRKQTFDNEAIAVAEVKPGHTHSINPVEELRRLKHKYEAWKKDYKVRLREAKTKIRRQGQAEMEKHRRKWWGKKSV